MNRLPIALLLAAVTLLGACGSELFDDGIHRRFVIWPLSVDNRTNEVIQVELDGRFLATVGPGAAISAEAEEGHHHLEAFDRRGVRVADRGFYLDREFIWILEE